MHNTEHLLGETAVRPLAHCGSLSGNKLGHVIRRKKISGGVGFCNVFGETGVNSPRSNTRQKPPVTSSNPEKRNVSKEKKSQPYVPLERLNIERAEWEANVRLVQFGPISREILSRSRVNYSEKQRGSTGASSQRSADAAKMGRQPRIKDSFPSPHAMFRRHLTGV